MSPKTYQISIQVVINIINKMSSDINHSTNSINELLQIFKQFRDDANKDNHLSTSHTVESKYHTHRTDCSQQLSSFTHQYPRNLKYGLHSSLERVHRSKEGKEHFSSRGSHALTETYDHNIFNRLYNENKELREKRQRLFQEGRRSIEAKQTKECTFSPNVRVRSRVDKSVNQEDSEAFYQKNMEWQSKRELSIKRKQCDRNSGQKDHLTFAPKIRPFRKKNQANKENSQYSSIRKNDSYLQNYHKTNQKPSKRRAALEPIQPQTSCVGNIRRGYFSYVV